MAKGVYSTTEHIDDHLEGSRMDMPEGGEAALANAEAGGLKDPNALASEIDEVIPRSAVEKAADAQRSFKASEVKAWSHGTGLIITPQEKSHRFSHIFRTCHAHARSPCCVHGRDAVYHTQTCRTSDEKW